VARQLTGRAASPNRKREGMTVELGGEDDLGFAELVNRLDSRPGVRGRQFERICVWYLRCAPEYRGRFRKVWLWSEWPGAWAPDAGIDLVAEEHGGDLWAIQAKIYDPGYAIKKADVDSFLAESSRPGFSYRLLIATTDRLGPTARRTLDDQREPVGYLLRSGLEVARWSGPLRRMTCSLAVLPQRSRSRTSGRRSRKR
jgi:hypothetical protein